METTPNIAADLVTVVAAIDTMILDDVTSVTAALAVHLHEVAQRSDIGDAAPVVMDVVAAFLADRYNEHPVFQPVVADRDLSSVVADLMLRGIDAERLVAGLIAVHCQHHIGLVWHEARRIAPRLDRDAEDLVGWGYLGLRLALRGFDAGLGWAFSTYAIIRIRGAILDGCRDENPIPKRLLTLQRQAAAAAEWLADELGRPADNTEIAEHIGCDVAVLDDVMPRLVPAASVEEMEWAHHEYGVAPVEALMCRADPADSAERASTIAVLRDALDRIDPKDAEAVRLIVVAGMSTADAHRRTGVSDRELRRRVERGCSALRILLSDGQLTAGI